MAEYKDPSLGSRPQTLDPNEYFNVSPDKRRAEQARATMRAGLKRQYLLQLNNPHRTDVLEDPALTRWVFARANPYPHFKPTTKTSLMGAIFGIAPLFIFYYVFKTSRDNREAEIKAGTLDRKFNMSS